MEQAFKRWGGFCLILGSLLMGIGNVLFETGLITENVIIPSLVLWGHGLLAFGIAGFAISLINDENLNKIMSATTLFIFANVVLGSGIGILILQSGGQLTMTLTELMSNNSWATVNFMIAHFGYVIALLVLLVSALSNSAFSNSSVYILIAGTILVGAGPFTHAFVFAIGFGLSLIGGVWVGKELRDDAISLTKTTTETT